MAKGLFIKSTSVYNISTPTNRLISIIAMIGILYYSVGLYGHA